MSVQLLMVDRTAAMLESLKADRVLRQVYYTPRAIMQSPEFAFAFFRIGADADYITDNALGGPKRFSIEGRILLSLVIKREATYATRELAELIDTVRRRSMKNIPDPACTISISKMQLVNDPLIANIFDDFGAATLAIDYTGSDQY